MGCEVAKCFIFICIQSPYLKYFKAVPVLKIAWDAGLKIMVNLKKYHADVLKQEHKQQLQKWYKQQLAFFQTVDVTVRTDIIKIKMSLATY